tara:strand:- start:2717 stop:3037 length:321 start_codon:yes stop_codon:yes gene_type:complete
MLKIKDDTVQVDFYLQILFAIIVAKEVYDKYTTDLVITSGSERSAKHSPTSLHYSGMAVDIRTRNLPEGTKEEVYSLIKEALNVDYDVILHSTHIHIEYQPKRQDN